MRDDVSLSQGKDGEEPVVVRLASRIVALLGAKSGIDTSVVRRDLAAQLESASFDANPDGMVKVLAEFQRLRISAASLADHYVPDVARSLGQGWLDDRISFADVSQGAARLQRLIRDLNGPWLADASKTPDVGELLLIVPEGEQHTLGAMVAMGQMRRRGVSVCLRFGPSRDELATLLFSRRFDGVFISLSSPEKLGQCKTLVALLKSLGGGDLPVVLGGPVIGLAPNAQVISGSDGATDDLDVALSVCGLNNESRTWRHTA